MKTEVLGEITEIRHGRVLMHKVEMAIIRSQDGRTVRVSFDAQQNEFYVVLRDVRPNRVLASATQGIRF